MYLSLSLSPCLSLSLSLSFSLSLCVCVCVCVVFLSAKSIAKPAHDCWIYSPCEHPRLFARIILVALPGWISPIHVPHTSRTPIVVVAGPALTIPSGETKTVTPQATPSTTFEFAWTAETKRDCSSAQSRDLHIGACACMMLLHFSVTGTFTFVRARV